MSLKCKIIPVTPFQQNCTLLWCDQTMEGAVVDPGGDFPVIEQVIKQTGVKLTKVLLTHGHLDHVGASVEVAKRFSVKIIGPQEQDSYWLDRLMEQSRKFGLEPIEPFLPDQWLNDGDTVSVGQETLKVLHCPGHTPGHVVFFSNLAKLAFVGDVLFAGSIGRTDFAHSNHNDLISAIRTKLWPLGDDVRFISGHGPMSDFGTERRSNPFVGENI